MLATVDIVPSPTGVGYSCQDFDLRIGLAGFPSNVSQFSVPKLYLRKCVEFIDMDGPEQSTRIVELKLLLDKVNYDLKLKPEDKVNIYNDVSESKNKNEYFYVAEFTKDDVLMRLAVNNNGYRYGVKGKKEWKWFRSHGLALRELRKIKVG
jgi:phage pi2 protein 07